MAVKCKKCSKEWLKGKSVLVKYENKFDKAYRYHESECWPQVEKDYRSKDWYVYVLPEDILLSEDAERIEYNWNSKSWVTAGSGDDLGSPPADENNDNPTDNNNGGNKNPSNDGGIGTGMIIGIVVIVLLVIGMIGWMIWGKKSQK